MQWHTILPKETSDLANTLAAKAFQEHHVHACICPPPGQIFRALELTPPESVKCVIIGQDPYHTPGQANGLAFAVNNGTQPSLDNIFKELQSDLGLAIPNTGDLTPWAERGVLLLNTSLTTKAHIPAAHKDWGWDKVTRSILETVSTLPQPIVFLLWGKHAQTAAEGIPMPENKYVIQSTHPSPFSAAKPTRTTQAFFGSRPFSKTNAFLAAHGASPVDWRL